MEYEEIERTPYDVLQEIYSRIIELRDGHTQEILVHDDVILELVQEQVEKLIEIYE
jgi:hypothetical protein